MYSKVIQLYLFLLKILNFPNTLEVTSFATIYFFFFSFKLSKYGNTLTGDLENT